MIYGGIDWPDGWQPGDRHDAHLGLHVLYHTENGRAFRVRCPMVREIAEIGANSWVAEYLTRVATWDMASWDIAVCKDPLVACGLCLLYDTTEADKTHVW